MMFLQVFASLPVRFFVIAVLWAIFFAALTFDIVLPDIDTK
jgi:hypothetical protein